MAKFREQLDQHLRSFRAAPFLFVGAGLSRRYLDIDGWEALLRRLSELTDTDFDFYFATAGGDFPTIATLIAEDLHPIWWREGRFNDHRKKFEGQLHQPESALKAEAAIYLADSMRRLPKSGAMADEVDLLRKVVIDGIITTNFDPLLEHIFPELRVFVGQERLLFNDALGVGEIYKIHGSHEEPDSLVLTRADYDRFHERNPYLAAKLMTIFVEHPILFLGYSLSDANVAAILSSILSCLDSDESLAKLADRLIFVQWDDSGDDPTMAKGVVRVNGKAIPVMTVTVPDFREVFGALEALQRGFPAKLLRQLKEQVYELVLEDNPKGRLHVAELDSDDDLSKVEVVFGVGAIAQLRSYVGLSRDDLITDLIDEPPEMDLNAVRVAQEALPNILGHPGNVPVFKYLREAGLLDQDGALLDPKSVDKKVANHVAQRKSRLAVLASYRAPAKAAVKAAKDLKNLIADNEPQRVIHFIPAMDEDEIDPEELRRFLVKQDDLCENESHRSQWMKLACLYDWLLYGRRIKPKPRPGRRPRRKSMSKASVSS